MNRQAPFQIMAARARDVLDHLSNGRLTLGVGLGHPADAEFENFGEEPDDKIRAAKLDEGLDILVGLWSGKTFSYDGEHYKVRKTVFLPRPKQRPRIPIWVGGMWPYKAPFRRAARWDGMIPLSTRGSALPRPEDIEIAVEYVEKNRKDAARNKDYAVAAVGWTTGTDRNKDATKVRAFSQVGANWWFEGVYPKRNSPSDTLKRIRRGPPRSS